MDEARECIETALGVFRQQGDPASEGRMLGLLGVLHYRQGRKDEAMERFEEGEALLRAADAPVDLSEFLCSRAEMEHADGALEAARATLREAEVVAAGVEGTSESGLIRRLTRLRQTLGEDG